MNKHSAELIGSALPNYVEAPNIAGSDATASFKLLAEPRVSGEPVKSAIDRAAKAAGFSYWRGFDIWYGKARRIEPTESASINAALKNKNRKELRHEVRDLRLRLARVEAMLISQDEEFHREDIGLIGAQVRGLG